ncbi:MAG: FKBP-type peptidyl-prolyl cis-trans isomerase [Candidatus Saccharimonadales bacterium]
MTKKRDRFFALMGAVLFFVTASALTLAVVISAVSESNKSKEAAKTPTTATCEDTRTDETTYPAPEAFTVTDKMSTLKTTDLTPGDGATAKSGDCLIMKYYGTLTDGTMFDENYTKPTAFAFTLGDGRVITGWDKGLVGMKVGGTRRLEIPAAQAYNDQATGSIPANSDLVFEVKLLRIQK